jgi:hypothetical protein
LILTSNFSGNITIDQNSCSTSLLNGDSPVDRSEPHEETVSPRMEDMGNLCTMGYHDLASLQARLELQMRKVAQQRDYKQAASIQSQVSATHDNLILECIPY